jgi:chromosomal replication initiator protein
MSFSTLPREECLQIPAQTELAPAWRTICSELRRIVGDTTYEIWLAPLQPQALEGELLILKAPATTESWVSNRFGHLVQRCAEAVLGPATQVRFTVEHGAGRERDHRPARPMNPEGSCNPRYSFDQFIIGESNRLAHAAALAVAELPGQAYNPLFLHAPPGLGKTHLLHAIGNYVLAFGGGATVRYATAEAFTNHFLTALGSKSLAPFKRAYRDADVLLIDDVQFLASKARTEEEFFHTFNALYENGRQLVLTCDRLPRALVSVEERLRERFEAGLVADISPPDHATRVAILRKRIALDRIEIDDQQVLELIAERVTTNVRALEGALIRVVAYHSLIQQPVDRALAARALDSMYPIGKPITISAAQVQSAVAARYKLSVQELVSASRTVRIAWPRQLAIQLSRDLTGQSLQSIGEAFGGRNHATVLHACKRVSDRLAHDQDLAVEIAELTDAITKRQADRDC